MSTPDEGETFFVTVTVVHEGDQTLLECTDCGVMGTFDRDTIDKVVFSHLADVHQCNMDTVDIHHLD